MKILLLVLGVVFAGCAAGEEGGSPSLEGLWATLDHNQCTVAVYFEGPTYQLTYVCELNDGSLGAVVSVGTYEVRPTNHHKFNVVSFMPEKSTCEGASPEVEDASYDFLDDGSLRLVDDSGITVFKRVDEPITGGAYGEAFTFGCFSADGVFTRRKLQNI